MSEKPESGPVKRVLAARLRRERTLTNQATHRNTVPESAALSGTACLSRAESVAAGFSAQNDPIYRFPELSRLGFGERANPLV